MSEDLTPVRCGCGGSPVFMTRGSATYLKCTSCGMESPKLSKKLAITAWNKAMRTSAEPERKKGKWIERKVYSMTIMDYQHAKCSVCGKYLTTPYQYFFDNYSFCPNCGAEMGKEDIPMEYFESGEK